MAVSIHLVLPADLVMSPQGLAGLLPPRHPQPDPLGPKKKEMLKLSIGLRQAHVIITAHKDFLSRPNGH